jgi:hypothetical protein
MTPRASSGRGWRTRAAVPSPFGRGRPRPARAVRLERGRPNGGLANGSPVPGDGGASSPGVTGIIGVVVLLLGVAAVAYVWPTERRRAGDHHHDDPRPAAGRPELAGHPRLALLASASRRRGSRPRSRVLHTQSARRSSDRARAGPSRPTSSRDRPAGAISTLMGRPGAGSLVRSSTTTSRRRGSRPASSRSGSGHPVPPEDAGAPGEAPMPRHRRRHPRRRRRAVVRRRRGHLGQRQG